MTAHFVTLLEELRRRSLAMASQVEEMTQQACDAVFDPDETRARSIVERDAEVDAAEVGVEAEVIRLLALYQPVGIDLRMLCTILKVNNDLERVADCAVNIAERACHGELQVIARRCQELRHLCPVVRQVLRESIQAYSQNDADLARQVMRRDQAIDALYGQIVRTIVSHPDRSARQLAGELDLLSVAKNLERIADHATNIAEDVVYLSTGQIVRHLPR